MVHLVSPWNMMDQFKCQRPLKSYQFDQQMWPVINTGTIVGTQTEMKDLFFLLWTNCVRVTDLKNNDLLVPSCTDQAVMNYMYHAFLHEDRRYKLLEPQKNVFCVLGEAVLRNYLDPAPEFKDGKLHYPNDGYPYVIFHQWERTKYREDILKAVL
jgi:hypothetical protein